MCSSDSTCLGKTHTHIHMYVYVCVYICMHIHIHMYTRIVLVFIYTQINTRIWIHMYMCICMWIYVHTQYTLRYTYSFINLLFIYSLCIISPSFLSSKTHCSNSLPHYHSSSSQRRGRPPIVSTCPNTSTHSKAKHILLHWGQKRQPS